jgi:uncharacterized protein YcgI (DUF1989 family)
VKTSVNQYVDSTTGDTGHYTFSGTKLMARASFDIKGIIPMDFLGEGRFKALWGACNPGIKKLSGLL